jgi:acetolactate synthase regulatory subunit
VIQIGLISDRSKDLIHNDIKEVYTMYHVNSEQQRKQERTGNEQQAPINPGLGV